jgi:hypothetical protein
VSSPSHLQGDHEEADTLIAFHMANLCEEDVVVRASDTDVLVILIGAIGRQIQGDRFKATDFYPTSSWIAAWETAEGTST